MVALNERYLRSDTSWNRTINGKIVLGQSLKGLKGQVELSRVSWTVELSTHAVLLSLFGEQ
jgi:hypothetical protein